MTDAEALDKARKLKALAEGGATEGERTAARNVLAKFTARYPQIIPLLNAAPPPPPPPPPSPYPSPAAEGAFGFPPHPPRPSGGFRPSGKAEPPRPVGGFMGSVWDFLQGAAQSLREGMTLREQIKDAATVTAEANTRTFTLRVAMPVRDLEDLLGDGTRDEEVATILAALVREEFLAVLASMDADDLDE
jgi:hypothetical protein